MARTKDQKKDMVKKYYEQIEQSKAFFVLEPNKLTANQAVELKKELFSFDSQYNVIKNSLFRLALQQAGIEIGKEDVSNPRISKT